MSIYQNELKEIRKEVEELVIAYRNTDNKKVQHFLIAEIYELTEEFSKNLAGKWKFKRGAFSYTLDELKTVITTRAFFEALQQYDPAIAKGDFMMYWGLICNNYYRNLMRAQKREQEKGEELAECVFDDTATGDNFENDVCSTATLRDLMEQFADSHKYGNVILVLAQDDPETATQRILEVLQADTYGDKERKKVQRVRESFRVFLSNKKYF